MRKLLFALLLLPCIAFAADYSEGYNYLELGAGYNMGKSDWSGDVPATVNLGHHFKMTNNLYFRAGVQHISNLDKGTPLNDLVETQLNWVYGIIGFKF